MKFVAARMDGQVPQPGADFEHTVPMPGVDGASAVRTVDRTREICAAFFGPGSDQSPTLGTRLANYEFRRAADALLDLARLGNLWFDAHAPWKSRKLDDLTDCHTSLWCHVQILSALAVGMWPFMPGASDRLRAMLALPALTEAVPVPRGDSTRGERLWRFDELSPGHTLGEPGILFTKIPDDIVEEERERLGATS